MMTAAVARCGDDVPVSEPRFVWQVSDERGEMLGALVIDDIVAGRACGGIRIAPGVTTAELRELAATMTLKFAFFGIACGGAKAGLIVPADVPTEERERRTRAFGAALAPLIRFGTYIPGTDLGCAERDLWEISAGAGLPAGRAPARSLVETNATASYSGCSAALAAIAALGRRVEGATLAVLGYGRVGAALAARFVAAGGRLVGIATAEGAVVDPAGIDVRQIERLRARYGDAAPLHYAGGRRVDPADLVGADADVLAPCATTHMIDAANVRRLRCRVVSPGANAAVTAAAEATLTAAGVTVVPDFVANAGGILVSHFWPLALPPGAVDVLLERRFRAIVTALVERAAAERTSVAELGRRLARENLARLARNSTAAMRHERWIARLARSRLQRALPGGAVTALVARIAERLGPDWRPAT